MTKNDMIATRRFGLLLTNGFALMSYASLIEPFRAANVLAGRALYAWDHVSIDGAPVRASNGATILADHRVGDPLDCDTLVVFAAGDPASFDDRATFGWLRQLARQGVRLAGISGGPYLLARAGLLEGHRATVHWEHAAAFEQAFPAVGLEPVLYVIDRRRITCAGGTAGLDLAIELIERDHGHALASKVGEWFIRTAPREAGESQRQSLRERYAVRNDRVLRVLAEMEARIAEPLGRDGLAARAGVSVRQLERLFKAHLGRTVADTQRAIRLDQAAQLLRSTGMTVTDIALACGFQSSSHFSRAYRAHFGHAPSQRRSEP
jgi:transcriptional regulator GlxA family with amidase domain